MVVCPQHNENEVLTFLQIIQADESSYCCRMVLYWWNRIGERKGSVRVPFVLCSETSPEHNGSRVRAALLPV